MENHADDIQYVPYKKFVKYLYLFLQYSSHQALFLWSLGFQRMLCGWIKRPRNEKSALYVTH